MKPALICFAFILLVGLIGCNREHDKSVNAPRTESASSVAGWTDVSTSGIALRFPDDWKLIDLTREGFEHAADKVFGSDPKLAALRSQVSTAAQQGQIKLWAFETALAAARPTRRDCGGNFSVVAPAAERFTGVRAMAVPRSSSKPAPEAR